MRKRIGGLFFGGLAQTRPSVLSKDGTWKQGADDKTFTALSRRVGVWVLAQKN